MAGMLFASIGHKGWFIKNRSELNPIISVMYIATTSNWKGSAKSPLNLHSFCIYWVSVGLILSENLGFEQRHTFSTFQNCIDAVKKWFWLESNFLQNHKNCMKSEKFSWIVITFPLIWYILSLHEPNIGRVFMDLTGHVIDVSKSKIFANLENCFS